MNFPFFYISSIDPSSSQISLDEETSKHIIQVLRMKTGERINLTDGKGNLITTEILDEHRKATVVRIMAAQYVPNTRKKSCHWNFPVKKYKPIGMVSREGNRNWC